MQFICITLQLYNLIIHSLLFFKKKVKEGDYFSAGGWSGKIKRISHENGDSKPNNRNFENGRVAVAETGWGVRLT